MSITLTGGGYVKKVMITWQEFFHYSIKYKYKSI